MEARLHSLGMGRANRWSRELGDFRRRSYCSDSRLAVPVQTASNAYCRTQASGTRCIRRLHIFKGIKTRRFYEEGVGQSRACGTRVEGRCTAERKTPNDSICAFESLGLDCSRGGQSTSSARL